MKQTLPAQPTHPWDVTPKQAIEIQKQLCGRVIKTDRLGKIRFVAGVDVGFEENNKITRAAVAVLTFPALELYEKAVVRRKTMFPYIPGLLSFREAPAVLDALDQLNQRPDLLLCDGQGIAHPRRFGIACHLGVLTDIPSIGVGKTRLVGEHADVPPLKGAWVPLIDKNEIVGAVLRSRENVKPIFISIGHRTSLETAIHYVLACITKYRLPETTRWAHRLASG